MSSSLEEYGIDDYFAVIRRRKWHILAPVAAIVAVGIVLLQVLAPVYRATATITINRPEIPENLIEPTVVTGYVDERIAAISRHVLKSKNLIEIAKRYNAYPKSVIEQNPGEIVEEMRTAVLEETVDVEVSDSRGKATVSTIAITISYDNKDPEVAQKIANEIARQYVLESERRSIEKAKEVVEFLQVQTARARETVNDLEAKLADFKSQHAYELPEVAERNRERLEQMRSQIEQNAQRIRVLEDQQISLRGVLARTPRFVAQVGSNDQQFLSPRHQLASLGTKYLHMSARYASEHPDLMSIRNEIEALSSQVTNGGELVNWLNEFERLRANISAGQNATASRRSLEQVTNRIEQITASITAEDSENSETGVAANNPAYLELETRLRGISAEINTLQGSNRQIEEQILSYRDYLASTPGVEKEYRAISRDYENAVGKYQELQAKAAEARLALQLEDNKKGERFSLAQEASMPFSPVSPNKIGILALSVMLGFVGGLTNAALAEYRSDAIYGLKDLVRISGAPPLASIPDLDRQQMTGFARLKPFMLLLLLGAAVLAFYLFGGQGDASSETTWFERLTSAFSTETEK